MLIYAHMRPNPSCLPSSEHWLGSLYDSGMTRKFQSEASEVRHLSLGRVARHVEQRGVSAGVVMTERDQPLHAERAHVAERHRRAGRVLGFIR